MRFMAMVKSDDRTEAGVMPTQAELTAMGKYNEELIDAGVMQAGEGLHPSSKGARVNFQGGDQTVVDGPFTEAKELIGGFWIIEADSLEDAIEWIRRAPLQEAQVEIRQVFEAEDFGDALTPELRDQEERLRARSAAQRP